MHRHNETTRVLNKKNETVFSGKKSKILFSRAVSSGNIDSPLTGVVSSSM